MARELDASVKVEWKSLSGVRHDPNTHVALVTRVALAFLVVGRVPSSLLWENRDAVNSPSFNVPESESVSIAHIVDATLYF